MVVVDGRLKKNQRNLTPLYTPEHYSPVMELSNEILAMSPTYQVIYTMSRFDVNGK